MRILNRLTASIEQFIFFVLFSFMLSYHAWAGVLFGTGLHASMGGRFNPSIHVGYQFEHFGATAYSVGAKSSIYLHQAYQLNFYYLWHAGELLDRPVTAGIGVGGFGAIKTYKSFSNAQPMRHYDGTAGPGFRVSWKFLDPVFLSIDGLFGVVADTSLLLTLNAQDIVNFAIGVQF